MRTSSRLSIMGAALTLVMGVGCGDSVSVVGDSSPTEHDAAVMNDHDVATSNPADAMSTPVDAATADMSGPEDHQVPAPDMPSTDMPFMFRPNLCTVVRGMMSNGDFTRNRIGCTDMPNGAVIAGLDAFQGFYGDSVCMGTLCRQTERGADHLYHMLDIHRAVDERGNVTAVYGLHLVADTPDCPTTMARPMSEGVVRIDLAL